MKLSAILLSIVLATQTLWPCSDSECAQDTSTELHQESEDHHEHDDCSPLCSCHCCHLQFHTDCQMCLGGVTFFENNPSPVRFDLFSKFARSIWDPPKFKLA